jgi:phthalate 4,5-dioxygenase oxygenase subunit
MLTREQNERLTRVGPGTPMGELFRRYWLPVALSEELPQPDCAPVRVQVLGEELVAFRDSSGRIGLLQERCPHRGASLAYGRTEEGGLRCIYHGWKFDVSGACLDAPNVTKPGFCSTLRAKSYPVRETAGAVWAYMGSEKSPPPFRDFGWTKVPDAQRRVWKVLQESNFAQGMERDLDTVHTPTHRILKDEEARAGARLLDIVREQYGNVTMETERTGYGLRSIALQPAGDAQEYVRITTFVMPCFLFVWPVAGSGDCRAFAFVPRDDHSFWHFIHLYNAGKPIDDGYRRTRGLDRLDAAFRKLDNIDNRHGQDREAMKSRLFNGVRGVIIEDHMLAEIQGPVADRSAEHLVDSDLPVVEFRRLMLDALDACAAGRTLPGSDGSIPYHLIDGRDFTKPRDVPWSQVSPPEDSPDFLKKRT